MRPLSVWSRHRGRQHRPEHPQRDRAYRAAVYQRALVRTDGNKTAAAKVLGISPRSLHYKIKEYGL